MSMTPAAEERTVRTIVDRLVDAWHRGDAQAFASVFADDAEFVNVFAERLSGRAAIAAHHAELFAGVYRGTRVSDVQVSVRWATPEAAVVSWSSVLHVGGEGRRAHALSVAVRRGHDWHLVSLQNMVPLTAPPH